MEKDIFRSQFRLPWSLYEQLKVEADKAGRSLNAEIVARLQDSFSGGSASDQEKNKDAIADAVASKVVDAFDSSRIYDLFRKAMDAVMQEDKKGKGE